MPICHYWLRLLIWEVLWWICSNVPIDEVYIYNDTWLFRDEILLNGSSLKSVGQDDLFIGSLEVKSGYDESLVKDGELLIVPNPVNDYFSIVSGDGLYDWRYVDVFSVNGSLIKRFLPPFGIGKKLIISELQSGMYNVIVNGDDLSSSLKLIKAK